MKKEYEIALSYAHKDRRIEKIIEEELEKIFTGSVFTDMLRGEKLANAGMLKEKLQSIFRDAEYSIILYSKNYYEGNFTHIEMEEIVNGREHGKEPHFFIIKIDDEQRIPPELEGRGFIDGLNVPKVFKEDKNCETKEYSEAFEDVTNQIRNIIHKRIVKSMVEQTIAEKSEDKEISLNIHTTFGKGNEVEWKMDFDWNLLGTAYVEDGSRTVRRGTTWQEFWNYVKKEFVQIKKNINKRTDMLFKIQLNCQLSIAYMLGQYYGDLGQVSANRNLVLTSSNRSPGCEFPFKKETHYILPEDFCREYEGNNSRSTDIACIISIKTRENTKIVKTVKEFLNKQGISCCKIYLFQKIIEIKDTDTLEGTAEYLREKMEKCRTGSECRIHLFPDTMAPLMFVLGARTIVPGRLQLYEYDLDNDSYIISLEKMD